MMAILSASFSASSRWCVVKTIALLSRTFSNIFHIYYRDTGSIPEVGSSRKMIFDPPVRAIPRDSFRLLPPLRFLASFSRSCCKPTSLIINSISFDAVFPSNPLMLAMNCKCSYTVMSSYNTSLWVQSPISYLASSKSSSNSSPKTIQIINSKKVDVFCS